MQWLRGCQRFGALLRVADGCAGYAETQPRPAPPKRSGCSMLRLSTLSTSGPRSTRSAVSTSGPAGPPADWACCRAGPWFSRTTGLQRARSTCRSSQGTGVCATHCTTCHLADNIQHPHLAYAMQHALYATTHALVSHVAPACVSTCGYLQDGAASRDHTGDSFARALVVDAGRTLHH